MGCANSKEASSPEPEPRAFTIHVQPPTPLAHERKVDPPAAAALARGWTEQGSEPGPLPVGQTQRDDAAESEPQVQPTKSTAAADARRDTGATVDEPAASQRAEVARLPSLPQSHSVAVEPTSVAAAPPSLTRPSSGAGGRAGSSQSALPQGPSSRVAQERLAAQDQLAAQVALLEARHRAQLQELEVALDEARASEHSLMVRQAQAASALLQAQSSLLEVRQSEASLRAQVQSVSEALGRSTAEVAVSQGFVTEMREHVLALQQDQVALAARGKEEQVAMQQQLFKVAAEAQQEKIALAEARATTAQRDAQIVQLQQELEVLRQAAAATTATAPSTTTTEKPARARSAQKPLALAPSELAADITAAFIAAAVSTPAPAADEVTNPTLPLSVLASSASAYPILSAVAAEPAAPAEHIASAAPAVSAGSEGDAPPSAVAPATSAEPMPAPVDSVAVAAPDHSAPAAASSEQPIAPPLEADTEFALWLSEKQREEELQQQAFEAQAGPPVSSLPFASTPLKQPSLLPAPDDVPSSARRRDAFPTREAEEEFLQWLSARREDEAAQAALALSAPPLHEIRPTTAAVYREGEEEFAQWLAKQQGGAEEKEQLHVHMQVQQPRHSHAQSLPVGGGSHLPVVVDSVGPPLQPGKARAWADGGLQAKMELEAALAAPSALARPARVPMLAGSATMGARGSSVAALPGWAAAPRGESVSNPSSGRGPSLDVSAGAASAREARPAPPRPFSYGQWQSHAAEEDPTGSRALQPAPPLSPPPLPAPVRPVLPAKLPTLLDLLPRPPLLWLRADSFVDSSEGRALVDSEGKVQGWADSGPYANGAVLCSKLNRSHLTSSHRSVGGHALLELPGHTAFQFAQPIPLHANSDWHVFVVGRLTGAFQFLLGGRRGAHLPAFHTAGAPVLACAPGVGGAGTMRVSDQRAGSGIVSFGFSRSQGKFLRAFLHGHDVTASGANGSPLQCSSSLSLEYLGQCIDELGEAQHCSPALIAEIIIVDVALDDQQRAAVEKLLHSKYRLYGASK